MYLRYYKKTKKNVIFPKIYKAREGNIFGSIQTIYKYSIYANLFFLSMQSVLQFFVIDLSATFQNRRLIFCMSIDNDLLHRGIVNRHSPVYSSLQY